MHARKRTLRIKAQSLLALSSLIGITAVVSLAAWTASSYLTGTATTGTFNALESNATDPDTAADWAPHTSAAGAGGVAFQLPAGTTALTPDSSTYAPIALRVASGTNVAPPVKLTTTVTSGTGIGMTYRIFTTSTFGCNASSTPVNNIVPSLISVVNSAPAGTFTLAAGTSSTPGAATYLCLVVNVDSSFTQTSQVGVQWIFTGGW